jgi:hypothetical protein
LGGGGYRRLLADGDQEGHEQPEEQRLINMLSPAHVCPARFWWFTPTDM